MRYKNAFLAVIFAVLCSSLYAGDFNPVTPDEIKRFENSIAIAKQAWRDRLNELRQAGVTDAAKFREIDQYYLDIGRKLEPSRQRICEHIERVSGVRGLTQGGAGSNPLTGRGVFGDIDTNCFTPENLQKINQAARNLGMELHQDGLATTLREINVTTHAKIPSVNVDGFNCPAPGTGKESAIGYVYGDTPGSRGSTLAADVVGNDPLIKVNDNLKKYADKLNLPTDELLKGDNLQELAKMTTRNMEAVGIHDPGLFEKLQQVRKGLSPEAAGLVKPGTTAEELADSLRQIQGRCADIAKDSLQRAQAISSQRISGIVDSYLHTQGEIEKLHQLINQAGDAAEIDRLKGQLAKVVAEAEESKRALVITDRLVGDSTAAMLKNQPQALELMAGELGAIKPGGVKRIDGHMVVEFADGRVLTQSQIIEAKMASAPAGKVLREEVESLASKIGTGAGWAFFVLDAYMAVNDAAKEAVDQEKEGDSGLKTYAKTLGMAGLNLFGYQMMVEPANNAAKDAAGDIYTGDKSKDGALAHSLFFLDAVGRGFLYFGKSVVIDAPISILGLGYDWTTGEYGANAANTQVTIDGMESAYDASSKISALSRNLQSLGRQAESQSASLSLINAWYNSFLPRFLSACANFEIRLNAIAAASTAVPALKQKTGNPNLSPGQIQKFNDLYGGLAGDYAVLTKEIEATLSALQRKTITPQRGKQNLLAFRAAIKALDEKFEKTSADARAIGYVAAASLMYQTALKFQKDVKEGRPQLQVISNLLTDHNGKFSPLATQFGKTAADYDNVRRRLLSGLVNLSAKLPPEDPLRHTYVKRFESFSTWPVLKPQADQVRTMSAKYERYATESGRLAGRQVPEIKGHDDLLKSGPAACKIISNIQGAGQKAMKTRALAHEALKKLEALLGDVPDSSCTLEITAPDNCTEGDSITMIFTLNNPPELPYDFEFREDDGSTWYSTKAAAEDGANVKREGNRVTFVAEADSSDTTIHARAVDPKSKTVFAQNTRTIRSKPKDKKPVVSFPPQPPRSTSLPQELIDYQNAKKAYDAARTQSPPPGNLRELSDDYQRKYRAYVEWTTKQGQDR